MGLSFPLRFIRSALGPLTLRDNYPVENPETDIGAKTFLATFAAVAGMNQTAARAQLVAVWNGAAFNIAFQAEAWNPEGNLPRPTLSRTSAGIYTYVFASTYADEDGTPRAVGLTGARCSSEVNHANGRIRAYAWPTGFTVDIKLEDSAGTARDAAFWLEVL